MKKPFDKWNQAKKEIHTACEAPMYHEREVWFCSLGVNVGNEIDGTGANYDRPVLVIKGFNTNTFFGVALTGRKKEGKFYYYLGKVGDREASANLSQIKVVDTKRLVRKIATVNKEHFAGVQERLQAILF